jgi:hypothetical protein
MLLIVLSLQLVLPPCVRLIGSRVLLLLLLLVHLAG